MSLRGRIVGCNVDVDSWEDGRKLASSERGGTGGVYDPNYSAAELGMSTEIEDGGLSHVGRVLDPGYGSDGAD